MNLLGREHRIEFVLSSHARFLSGAHEGQWDGEVGLYYLRARYYDPSLGRFIQEDAVEGSADLPASQNRYVYCQNDPVSLIDPTGYSPENTGTPARYTLLNIGNYTAETSACYLPDVTIFSMNSSGINPIHEGDPMPIPEPPTSDINSPEACSSGSGGGSGQEATKWELRNQHGQIIAEDKGDGSGPVFYEIDKEGNLVLDEDGKPIALKNTQDIEKWFDNIMTAFGSSIGVGLQGKAWNDQGDRIDFIVTFMREDKTMTGFSIRKSDHKLSSNIMLFDERTNKELTSTWETIKKAFANDPSNNPITPGTLLTFEVSNKKQTPLNSKEKGPTQTYTVNITRYDFVNKAYKKHYFRFINFIWKHRSALV
jgi:RHS repeat-associated protein